MPLPFFDNKKMVSVVVSKRKKDGRIEHEKQLERAVLDLSSKETKKDNAKSAAKKKKSINFVKEARSKKKGKK